MASPPSSSSKRRAHNSQHQHQHGFYWPLEFIERYLKSLNSFKEIEFVELGYWKQSGKFEGPFYSIEENLLSSICKMTKKQLSIMVDYHYCSHNVEDFPSTKYFNEFYRWPDDPQNPQCDIFVIWSSVERCCSN